MIRNFAIIAHIDSGKTTLTDRILQLTGTVNRRDFHDRFLDANPIEQERGVTIKLAPVTMAYQHCTFNLIDTPGHVDFSYEVNRSLAACEGAILLIDATRGIQAQTLSHAHTAVNLGLTLVPAINKIDLESADIDNCLTQLNQVFGFKTEEVSLVSAKTGRGVDQLLGRIITDIPAPKGHPHHSLRALVFNSTYDQHLGVIAFVKVVDGQIKASRSLLLIQANQTITPKEIGIFAPQRQPTPTLATGQVGYIATGLKDIHQLKVGDTITIQPKTQGQQLKVQPLPGYHHPQPVVFADAYPDQATTYQDLTAALDKLRLSDASLTIKPVHSSALGPGLRLGFLGLFHIDITKERLQREYAVSVLLTSPTVEYYFDLNTGAPLITQSASEFPPPSTIKKIQEPMVKVTLITPSTYLGNIIKLLQSHRGSYQDTTYFGHQVQLTYHFPLAELISGFVDQLKSVSQGYASFDYQPIPPQPVNAVKLDVLVNHQPAQALSRIVVKNQARAIGERLVNQLKDLMPSQQFAVPLQAAIGGEIIARATKPAVRKDVTAKLYGGDQTRKDKLLKKQKKGKKHLALIGRVRLPSDVISRLATS